MLPLTITDGGTQELLLVLGGFLLGLGIVYWGFRTYQTGRLIRNTPTEKVRSIALGRTEVNGQCRDAGTTFDQPFSEGRCVYRQWKVEEYKRDHSDDDNGKEWQTVDSGTDVTQFYAEDETGQVLVDATDDATFQISDENSVEITVGRGQSLPPRVEAFYEDDEDARQHQQEQLKEAMPDSMLGGFFGSEGAIQDADDADDPAQFYQQYVPDEMLDEDGRPREDLSEEEMERLVREHARKQQQGQSGQQTGGQSPGQRSGGSGQMPPGQQSGGDDDSMLGSMGDFVGSMADTVSALGSMGSGNRPSSRYRRRFTHEVLPVDEHVYVFGGAYQREGATGSNADRIVIRTDEGTDRFIVSDQDESSLARKYTIWAPIYMLIGLVLSSGALYILLNDWVLA
jgi:hypothetical protein